MYGGHCRHTLGLGPAGVTENVFTPQSVHVADFSSEKDPVVHGTHVDESEAPTADDAVPAAQFTHVCALLTVCEYVPCWHCCAVSCVSTLWLTLAMIAPAPWLDATEFNFPWSMVVLAPLGLEMFTWITSCCAFDCTKSDTAMHIKMDVILCNMLFIFGFFFYTLYGWVRVQL